MSAYKISRPENVYFQDIKSMEVSVMPTDYEKYVKELKDIAELKADYLETKKKRLDTYKEWQELVKQEKKLLDKVLKTIPEPF